MSNSPLDWADEKLSQMLFSLIFLAVESKEEARKGGQTGPRMMSHNNGWIILIWQESTINNSR